MNEGGIDIDKKRKGRPNLLLVLVSFLSILTLMFYFILIREGWLNEKLTIEGVITRVEFSPGGFRVPPTVIVTFENGEIKQFEDGSRATFRLGVKHTITYKETPRFSRIIDIKRAY